MERDPAKGVEPKMRGRKIKKSVNWQAAIKQNGVKQTGIK
jgi:hypothetical protein